MVPGYPHHVTPRGVRPMDVFHSGGSRGNLESDPYEIRTCRMSPLSVIPAEAGIQFVRLSEKAKLDPGFRSG